MILKERICEFPLLIHAMWRIVDWRMRILCGEEMTSPYEKVLNTIDYRYSEVW